MRATGSTAFALEIQALQKLLADKDAQIERLKTLCASAAYTLSEIRPSPCNGKDVATVSEWWRATDKLVADLRKAAQ